MTVLVVKLEESLFGVSLFLQVFSRWRTILRSNATLNPYAHIQKKMGKEKGKE
jgi:hypothetical protein